MIKILLVDDSDSIGLLVKQCLSPFEVTHVQTFADARSILADGYFDLLLIDVTMPDGNGFSFCEELSKDPKYLTVPLILLTGKNETSDKVFGLGCGACDYITKPFNGLELKARVDTHLRRQKSLNNAVLKTPYIELDLSFQRCKVNEDGASRDPELTPTEFRLLSALLRNIGVPLSRDEILKSVWSSQGIKVEAKGLDTHISHLRRKLGSAGALISSVYGRGYVLRKDFQTY